MQNPSFSPGDAELGVKYSKNDVSEIAISETGNAGKKSARNGSTSCNASVLSAHNIDYWVKVSDGCCKSTDKQILTNISAVFKQGMSAIMGPTGSGKSSFLDVLAGRKDPAGVKGHLLLDGKPVPENFKCMVGYVVQDDVVMGTLTVRENFAFSAALRLPSSVSGKERDGRVSEVIRDLGLARCADTKVGNEFIRGISGGERKRCNIGMELIISPPVLFLDEPTTGLDANTANTVLMFLRKLSRKGRTIIFSIHQPRFSIYRLFDNLLLLSQGVTVYHGPARQALDFFQTQGFTCQEHNNPPDFFLDVINGDLRALADDQAVDEDLDSEPVSQHDKLVEGFQKSQWNQSLQSEAKAIFSQFESNGGNKGTRHDKIDYATSFGRQVGVLALRSVRNLVRNPATAGITIGSSLLFSILISAIFWQLGSSTDRDAADREGVLFFLIMNQLFFNMSAVEIFINERKLFMHENMSGFYRVSSYFIVKLVFDIIPLRMVPAILMSCIVYFSVDLRPGADNFFLFMLCLFMTCLAAACLCFLLSSLIRVFSVAQLTLALSYVLMMLFGGFLIQFDSIGDWLSWLQYFSIFKYGMTALYIIEFKDREFCNATACFDANSRLDRSDMDYETTWDFWQNYVALAGMSLILLILCYIQLRRMKKTT
ncbi:hypothetical protein EGW08_005929 [Elysia chlorotica]|uniref:ABC transporter domain-containing protein n=1 Tax=Elysia chlorotica TaxID=188477 RepID=A0A433TXL0_ELYCH|nr:hypothetical protein EGW08_005929 [Elysia chlorotica]